MRHQIFLLLLASSILSACAPAKVYLKGYAGDDIPQKQLALLKPTANLRILSIDGDPGKAVRASQAFGTTDYEIGLTPGEHTVVLIYYSGDASSKSTQVRTFKAEAGRKYLIQANVEAFPLRWNPSVVDVTDRIKCWSVLAAKSCT